MYLGFFIFVSCLILLIDFLFYRGLKAAVRKLDRKYQRIVLIAHWTVTLWVFGVFVYTAVIMANEMVVPRFVRTYLGGMNFVILVSKMIGLPFILIDELFLGIRGTIRMFTKKKGEPTPPDGSRRDFLKKTGVIAAGIPFVGLTYGIFKTAFDYEVRKVALKIPGLPLAFKGMKIVQVSDIHSGSFVSPEPLEKAVSIINEQSPNVIFFTGDLVNEIAEEALPFVDTFRKLEAPYGVYSILGNHDYGDYYYQRDQFEQKAQNKELMQAIHKANGWNLLLNEHAVIKNQGEKLAIIGVENWGAGRFAKYGELATAMQGTEGIETKLLLSHDPSHWDAQIRQDAPEIAATFSGHTHGMQMGIKLPSGYQWSPSQWMYEQWSGLYANNNQQLYVNTGLGFIGYPGRVGIKPEITVFELA